MFGDVITGSYPLSASLSRIYIPSGTNLAHFTFDNLPPGTFTPPHSNKKYINALKATLTHSTRYSQHFAFSSSSAPNPGNDIIWDKGQQRINMVCVPSIFYGSRLRPGSISLKYYSSGRLVGQLTDVNKNGELIEQLGSNVGAVAGVALYSRGILLLTGSWDISTNVSYKEKFEGPSSATMAAKWLHFGSGLPQVGTPLNTTGLLKSSFQVEFEGENKIPTMTLMAHASRAELNYSINPTYIDKTKQAVPQVTRKSYSESQALIKNTRQLPYTNSTASFERQTFISSVGIYDENHNLIGIAKVATPIKKTEDIDYTFKLKLDF